VSAVLEEKNILHFTLKRFHCKHFSIMASGKKGRKKGQTLDFYQFLNEGSNIAPDKTVVIAPKALSSWADDVDEDAEYISRERIVLPTAPKASRGSDIDESLIPRNGPYCARVANLPYDIDEPDIDHFFKGLKIKNIKMPRDGNRIKGYAFVEFEDKLQLIEALGNNDLLIKNRKIKVELNLNEDRNRNRGPQRDFESQEDRTVGDWRSARAELPPPPPGRDYRDRDRGYGKFEDKGFGGRRNFGGGSFERREREPEVVKERPRLQLAPRTKPVEKELAPSPTAATSSIFGGAKPVDTLKRELQIEEKLKSRTISPPVEEKPKPKVDIFGGARPVDTLTREMEIEEKLRKERGDLERSRPSQSNGYDRPRSSQGSYRSKSRDENHRSYRSSSRDELRTHEDPREYRESSRNHSPSRREPSPVREVLETPRVNAWAKKPSFSQESKEERYPADDRPLSSSDDRSRQNPDYYYAERDRSQRNYDKSRERDDRRDEPRSYNGRNSFERGDYRGGNDERGRPRYNDDRYESRGNYEEKRIYDDRRPSSNRRPYEDHRDGKTYESQRYPSERKDYSNRSLPSDHREPPRHNEKDRVERRHVVTTNKKSDEPPKIVSILS
ncbi:hypothetical protein QYM36_018068, partial [Artemia franciscana]